MNKIEKLDFYNLLHRVLGVEIESSVIVENNILYNDSSINKYEFMAKCKEWCYKFDEDSLNLLDSVYKDKRGRCILSHFEDKEEDCFKKIFESVSEFEAVILGAIYALKHKLGKELNDSNI